ncbi:hypothetical protein EUX98_g6757 [Antrodiella citrinella]|uniref:N-acetyltransferase domain-containing protein n=1 Tax=Antrodiella citrinella TaxID=2447956 RepID=A0A4S4MN69_9APHY|nr:hypothetical protein EUX98_g6757 [Antrodiella citrinella]
MLPEPSATFASDYISQATSAEVDALAQLYLDFASDRPSRGTLEEARERMERFVRSRHVWSCTLGGAIAGYVLVGRFTPRTVAIKNVYLSPSFRRRGIAEAMVRTVTRYYLGAMPLGFKGGPDTRPTEAMKQEICLNVVSEEAERSYKRSGF